VLDSRALVHLKLGEFEQALADYDAALKLDPAMAPTLYARGVTKLKLGDAAGAEADMVAAKLIEAGVAEEFAKYGVA
jgi:tetratricopeptide (TPR) repeat protein